MDGERLASAAGTAAAGIAAGTPAGSDDRRYHGRHRRPRSRPARTTASASALTWLAGLTGIGGCLVTMSAGTDHQAVLGTLICALSGVAAYLTATARYRHSLRVQLSEARRDPLTGLPTRACAEYLLSAATRDHVPLTIAVIDVDGLHALNNAFGHAAGDQYLQSVSRRLSRAVPAGGSLVRQGGDEFTLLAPGTNPRTLAATLTAATTDPITVAGRRLRPRVSAGLATSGGDDAFHAWACADAAMYTVKATGGDGALVYLPERDGQPHPDGTRPTSRVAAPATALPAQEWTTIEITDSLRVAAVAGDRAK